MQVTMNDGTFRTINLTYFGAMEGLKIRQLYREVISSPRDTKFLEDFVKNVMGHVTVTVGQKEIPLSTTAMIDNHLQSWTNIETVLNAQLSHNSIVPYFHEEHSSYWNKVGADMAVSFMASVQQLINPALQAMVASGETVPAEVIDTTEG